MLIIGLSNGNACAGEPARRNTMEYTLMRRTGRNLAVVFDLYDLIGVQLFADLQEHVGVGLFQVGAGLGYPVDLGKEGGLVRFGGPGYLLQLRLGLLETLQARREGWAILLKDGVHAGLLLGTEFDALGKSAVVPPTNAGWAELKPGPGGAVRGGVALSAGGRSGWLRAGAIVYAAASTGTGILRTTHAAAGWAAHAAAAHAAAGRRTTWASPLREGAGRQAQQEAACRDRGAERRCEAARHQFEIPLLERWRAGWRLGAREYWAPEISESVSSPSMAESS
jgi:hypothetical protein